MVVIEGKTTGDFEPSVRARDNRVRDRHLAATFLAAHVVMIAVCQFVSQVPIIQVGLPNQTPSGQELQRTIDRGLRKSWQGTARPGIDFQGRKMLPRVSKHVQDRKTLRRKASAVRSE